MKKNEQNSAIKLTNDLNTKYSDLAFPFTQTQYQLTVAVLAVIVGVLVSNCNCNYKNDAQYDLGKHSVYFAAGNNVPTTEVYSKKHDSENYDLDLRFISSISDRNVITKTMFDFATKVYLMRK